MHLAPAYEYSRLRGALYPLVQTWLAGMAIVVITAFAIGANDVISIKVITSTVTALDNLFITMNLQFFSTQTEQVKPVQHDAQATGLHAFATPALQNMGLTPSVRFRWTLSGTAESDPHDRHFSLRVALIIFKYILHRISKNGNRK